MLAGDFSTRLKGKKKKALHNPAGAGTDGSSSSRGPAEGEAAAGLRPAPLVPCRARARFPPGAFGSLLNPRTAAGGRGKQSRNEKGIPLISCWMLEELPAPASGNRQRPAHPQGISAGEPRGAQLTRSCCHALPNFLSIRKDRRMKGKPPKQQEGLKGLKISS